jgi:hypothetical protein
MEKEVKEEDGVVWLALDKVIGWRVGLNFESR